MPILTDTFSNPPVFLPVSVWLIGQGCLEASLQASGLLIPQHLFVFARRPTESSVSPLSPGSLPGQPPKKQYARVETANHINEINRCCSPRHPKGNPIGPILPNLQFSASQNHLIGSGNHQLLLCRCFIFICYNTTTCIIHSLLHCIHWIKCSDQPCVTRRGSTPLLL